MVERLIKRIAQRLDKEKIPYMIIGGQAVLIYGRARMTRDIDITLGVDCDKLAIVERVCKKLKLTMLPDKPVDFVKETRVLPAEEKNSRIRVDFIFSFTPYELRALERIKEISVCGYPVKFASCEDVIVHKMIAGRAVDLEDVKSILLKNKDIDVKYIKKQLIEFKKMDEYRGVLKKFSGLM